MVKIENIVKAYRTGKEVVPVLQGASAEIDDGCFSVVCGPSGCGKSTLLLILGGLLNPDNGSVIIQGEDFFALSPEKRSMTRARIMGFVFQRFHLVPYLTVEENIKAAGIALKEEEDNNRVEELLVKFNLTERREHVPGRLSVGEQQRTALARALYNNPSILLADEPTGNLDPENGAVVIDAFQEFAAKGGTAIMVTHSPDAAEKADRILLLKKGTLVEK